MVGANSMDASRYLSKLEAHLGTGRGVSVYECCQEQVTAFGGSLRDAGCIVQSVRLTEATSSQPLPALGPDAACCLVYQDLSVEALRPVIGELISRLIYPCYFRGRSLFFFSRAGRAEYLSGVRAEDLHTRYGDLVGGLLVEQLLDLVDQMSYERPAPVRPEPAAKPLPVDENLDANQQRAASHTRGPIRVLAPAGSGKTKTLINRIANLVNHGVRPGSVLALAFNKKAAAEMKQRLAGIGVPVSDRLDGEGSAIRTFHSFGYEIVRDHLGWRLDQMAGEGQSRRYLRQAIEEIYPIPRRRGLDRMGGFAEALTRTRMELPPIDEVAVVHGGQSVPFAPVFARYRELQAQRRFVDFDDMLYLPLRAMLDSRELRCRLQSRFEYILVDEFQDLNRAQMLFMQILALPQNNLFVVGDDDQMIYGWRGAEVGHILDFPESFPESTDCLLSTNYRSSHRIVQHARWLIDCNLERVGKDIRARLGATAGTFDIVLGQSLRHQARAAVDWIARVKEAPGTDWGDFAVLSRYKVHQFIVAMMLDREKIPHTAVDHGRLFQTRVGRDLHRYLRVVLKGDEASSQDFATVLTRPNRSLSRVIVNRITNWTRFVGAPDMEGLETWQSERLQKAVDTVLAVRGRVSGIRGSADAAVSAIAEGSGLGEFYRGSGHSPPAPDATTDDVLLEVIVAVAAGFGSAEEFLAHMDQAIRSDGDGDAIPEERPANAVVLSTIHSTKGNEYANVVYFNLKEQKDADAAQVEEERRVAYVGVTRAIDSILITAPEDEHSPFVKELALNPGVGGLSTRRLVLRLGWCRILRRWRSRDLGAHLTGDGPVPDTGLRGTALPDPHLIGEMEAEIRFRRVLRRRRWTRGRRRAGKRR